MTRPRHRHVAALGLAGAFFFGAATSGFGSQTLKQVIDAAVGNDAVAPVDDGLRPLGAPDSPVIVRNGADGATRPGVTVATVFRLERRMRIDQVMTYHYGARKRPGTIALRADDGTIYGPWQASGAVGQGNVPHAYWWARPGIVIEAGGYTVIDSDPPTWSREEATHGAGIFQIWGRPAP